MAAEQPLHRAGTFRISNVFGFPRDPARLSGRVAGVVPEYSGASTKLQVALQYRFQAFGPRGPAKYHDMLLKVAKRDGFEFHALNVVTVFEAVSVT